MASLETPNRPSATVKRRRRRRREQSPWMDPSIDAATRPTRALAYEWSLACGRPIRRSTLDLIAATRAALGKGLERWTSDDVASMLWVDVFDFCEAAEVETPLDLPEVLWSLLSALEEAGRLGRTVPMEHLIEPLIESGGLDPEGLRRHSATMTRAG